MKQTSSIIGNWLQMESPMVADLMKTKRKDQLRRQFPVCLKE